MSYVTLKSLKHTKPNDLTEEEFLHLLSFAHTVDQPGAGMGYRVWKNSDTRFELFFTYKTKNFTSIFSSDTFRHVGTLMDDPATTPITIRGIYDENLTDLIKTILYLLK